MDEEGGGRHPAWVYDAGDEPDPRYSLANERTFLAWVRTSLGVLAGAVALESLQVPEQDGLRLVLVVALLLFGGLTATLSWIRWALVERAMRTRAPLPPFNLGILVTAALVVLSVLLAVTLAL
ncbi:MULTISPECIES: YidH family protein [unclassified Nocardioides]|uniref:YidH family protein n=1 Tax=unclassified Nocardioides TaxID=2615069 RepID=UPI003014EE2D